MTESSVNIKGEIKKLSSDAGIYGIGKAITSMVSVITAPILAYVFIPAEFGALMLVQTFAGFVVYFAGLNLNSGVFYHYFKAKDADIKKTILSTAFIFFIVFGFAIALFTEVLASSIESLLLVSSSLNGVQNEENVYRYADYIGILAIWIFFSLINTNFQSVLRMTRKPKRFVMLSISSVIINLIFIVILVIFLEGGIEGVLRANVFSAVIVSIVGFFMVANNYRFVFSWSWFRKILSYSLPQFPSGVMNLALIQLNVYFLNYYTNTTELGYYSIAFKVASGFLIFTAAFRMAWDPLALSLMEKNGSTEFYSRIYTLFNVGMGLLACFVALMAKPLLIMITPQEYHESYIIVSILIFAFLIQGSSNILAVGINISAKTKFISYAQFVALVANVLLNLVLVPNMGAWGAASAFLGGVIAQNLAYYFFTKYVYPIPFLYWKMQLYVVVLLVLVGAEAKIVENFDFSLSLIVGVAFILVCVTWAWWIGLGENDRKRLRGIFSAPLAKLSL